MSPDSKLVRRTLEGHAESFSELVLRWTRSVLGLCHALVRHRQAAEELTQETFVRAYVALGSLRDPERFAPWLRGIARRACLDWLRSQKRPVVLFSQLGADWNAAGETADDDGAVASVEIEEEKSLLLEEIDKLPEELRTVIMLYYYGTHTYDEIAVLIEVSRATVNTRLTKARVLLRRRLASPGSRP